MAGRSYTIIMHTLPTPTVPELSANTGEPQVLPSTSLARTYRRFAFVRSTYAIAGLPPTTQRLGCSPTPTPPVPSTVIGIPQFAPIGSRARQYLRSELPASRYAIAGKPFTTASELSLPTTPPGSTVTGCVHENPDSSLFHVYIKSESFQL